MMRLFTYSWTAPALESFAALAPLPYSLFFDSARAAHPLSQYSYLCWMPFEIIENKNGVSKVTNKDHQFTFDSNPFDLLRERLSLWNERISDIAGATPPFRGGAAGYFGYDLAYQVEKLPGEAKDDMDLPDMAIGLYDQFICFDHLSGKTALYIYAENEKTALTKKAWVEDAVKKSSLPSYQPSELSWQADCDEAFYEKKIGRVINYIEAGDIFQACLSRRFDAKRPQNFDSFAHYVHLRSVNPAPFGSYMNFGDFQIGSSSPERFLTVRNRQVETRPIKGTRRNDGNKELDALIRDGLLTNEKDRAENAMIVDLMRNDLSKVCADHSIKVPVLCGLESYEGLHHLVSVVQGTLRADQSSTDLMKACFPGGSITGAPKIRAMEIIDELEPNRRGPWCGAMGWIGFNGDMDTNITIRTVIYGRDKILVQSGGGIVADSIPADELQETLIKTEKLFESFGIKEQKKEQA